MKFNCGKSREQKLADLEIEAEKLKEWHDVFAWLPVRVSENDCRWLEVIERRFRWSNAFDVPLLFGGLHIDARLPEYRAKT